MIDRRSLLLTAPALLLGSPALAALAPTPGGTEGPFYPRTPPEDDDNDLVRVEGAVREAGGDILHLGGRVVDPEGAPRPGVRIEIWQADAKGIYRHPGDRRSEDRDAAFQGFGHATADGDGRFAFRTIVPVPYSRRTPHIHVKALANGRELLTTQLYRAGFPQNADDFLFRRLSEEDQERVSMRLRPRTGADRPTFQAAVRVVI